MKWIKHFYLSIFCLWLSNQDLEISKTDFLALYFKDLKCSFSYIWLRIMKSKYESKSLLNLSKLILQKMFRRTLPFLSVCRLESALTYAFVQLLRHFFAQLPDLILELPLSFASWEIHEQPQFTHNFLVKSKAYCYFRINKTKIIFQFLWGRGPT